MDWVREHDALLTIFRIKALRPGDELLKRVDGMEEAHTIRNQERVEAHYDAYCNRPDLTSRWAPNWTIIGWRRPNKEGG